MKKYIIVASLFICCKTNSSVAPAKESVPVAVQQDCSKKIDSLKLKIDSLKTVLFLSNIKVEKVRFYLNICLKRPSQDKFLKGWIKRALN